MSSVKPHGLFRSDSSRADYYPVAYAVERDVEGFGACMATNLTIEALSAKARRIVLEVFVSNSHFTAIWIQGLFDFK